MRKKGILLLLALCLAQILSCGMVFATSTQKDEIHFGLEDYQRIYQKVMTFEEQKRENEKKRINHVNIVSRPTKTEYYPNEEIELEGLKLEIVYKDMETEIIDSTDERLSVEAFDKEKIGPQSVWLMLKRNGHEQRLYKILIQVVNEQTELESKAIKQISKNTSLQKATPLDILYIVTRVRPSKLLYSIGEEVSVNGAKVYFVYSEGDNSELFSISDSDIDTITYDNTSEGVEMVEFSLKEYPGIYRSISSAIL